MAGSALRAAVDFQGSRKKDVVADRRVDGNDGELLPVHIDGACVLGETDRVVSVL